jgi:hypothetical protein
MVQGSKGSGFKGFRVQRVQGSKGSGFKGFRVQDVQGFNTRNHEPGTPLNL